MGQHYLPQHYLRGFTAEGRIWVYDKERRITFPSQPKTVANENDLYGEDLEAHLAERVEQPALSVLEKIRRRKAIETKDRRTLSEYIITMWKRVPTAKERVASHVPKLANSIRDNLMAGFAENVRVDPSLADAAERRKAEVDKIIDNYIADPPDYFWHHTVRNSSTPRIVNELESMSWNFLVSEKQPFLASDNPVFITPEGIGKASSELSIPISSEVTFWANRSPLGRPQYCKINSHLARSLNARTVMNARRFLYAAGNWDWMPTFAHKQHPLQRLK